MSSNKLLKLKVILAGQFKLWIACCLIGVCVFVLFRTFSAENSSLVNGTAEHRAFGSLIAQLSGTFAAVLMASVTLIFALPERPLLQEMRQTGHFFDLLATLLSAIGGCLVVMCLGVVLTIVTPTSVWVHILLSSFAPLGLLLLQAAIRLALTMFAVALPT